MYLCIEDASMRSRDGRQRGSAMAITTQPPGHRPAARPCRTVAPGQESAELVLPPPVEMTARPVVARRLVQTRHASIRTGLGRSRLAFLPVPPPGSDPA